MQVKDENQTFDSKVLELLFNDTKPMLTRDDAKDKVLWVLDMLTDLQKKEVLKKIERCQYFIERKTIGMNETKIRGLISRKFNVHRQHMNTVCEPCLIRYKKLK